MDWQWFAVDQIQKGARPRAEEVTLILHDPRSLRVTALTIAVLRPLPYDRSTNLELDMCIAATTLFSCSIVEHDSD